MQIWIPTNSALPLGDGLSDSIQHIRVDTDQIVAASGDLSTKNTVDLLVRHEHDGGFDYQLLKDCGYKDQIEGWARGSDRFILMHGFAGGIQEALDEFTARNQERTHWAAVDPEAVSRVLRVERHDRPHFIVMTGEYLVGYDDFQEHNDRWVAPSWEGLSQSSE